MVTFIELEPILRAAIGPVILISGVGLILLSMTNRYGRIIDRSRSLAEALQKAPPDQRDRFAAQLSVLSRRADLSRMAITLATISVLLAALLVISLFLTACFKWPMVSFSVGSFITCMVSLIASLFYMLGDLNLSLSAVKMEIEWAMPTKGAR